MTNEKGEVHVGFLVDGEIPSFDDTEFAWVDPETLVPEKRIDVTPDLDADITNINGAVHG